MDGWIKLWRQIQDSEGYLSEPFTRTQAWIDLLLLANHKQGFIRVRGNRINVNRGQVGWSQVKLAERWKWSRGKVRRFLLEMEQQNDPQLVQQKSSLTSLITIVNYGHYQGDGTADSTENGQQTVQQTDSRRYTNKNEKNEKNEKNKELYSREVAEVLAYLNKKTGKQYRKTDEIRARIKDGGTVEECLRIIDNQIMDDYFIENPKYLNPTTLFRKSHWDKYLNNIPNLRKGVISDTTERTLRNLKGVDLS